MNYGVTRQMSNRWMKKYIESLKQDKEFMKKVEKTANEIINSSKDVDFTTIRNNLLIYGVSATHFDSNGSVVDVTEDYIEGKITVKRDEI